MYTVIIVHIKENYLKQKGCIRTLKREEFLRQVNKWFHKEIEMIVFYFLDILAREIYS